MNIREISLRETIPNFQLPHHAQMHIFHLQGRRKAENHGTLQKLARGFIFISAKDDKISVKSGVVSKIIRFYLGGKEVATNRISNSVAVPVPLMRLNRLGMIKAVVGERLKDPEFTRGSRLLYHQRTNASLYVYSKWDKPDGKQNSR